MRRTVFKQFCGGVSETIGTNDPQDAKRAWARCWLLGGRQGGDEETFDVTFHKTMDVIELAKQHKGDGIPIVVFKPTGFTVQSLLSSRRLLNRSTER